MSAIGFGDAGLRGTTRTRPDRCPGVLRPWPAADGALVRVRVPGGQLPTAALAALVAAAEEYGDGTVRVTGRANLQLRALPDEEGMLPAEVVAAIEATGLLPSRTHDLARNVLCSPQTGRAGGVADLRPVVRALDRALCATPSLAALPGRFLFTLDDGRGDVRGRHVDLGLDALDSATARLRIGQGTGDVVTLDRAPDVLVGLAEEFVSRRGTGRDAAWHVDELPLPLRRLDTSSPCGSDYSTNEVFVGREAAGIPATNEVFVGRVAASASEPRIETPLPYGPVPGGEHVPIGEDGINAATAAAWVARTSEVVITPWQGVLV